METKKLSLEEMEGVEGGASVAAWGCGLSMGLIGGIWSVGFGMVSAGAGFVVGMMATAAAIEVCSGL